MSLSIEIHPQSPQPRLVAQIVQLLAEGQVAVLPTDSGYALVCSLENKPALQRIAQIRRDDEPHHMTLLCRDLSEISSYARVDNTQYRFLKAHTPSPITFILEATSEVPRRLLHPKKRSIGVRVPTHPVLQAILRQMTEPVLSASLVMPDQEAPLEDPAFFPRGLDRQVDLLVDVGFLAQAPSTVIEMTGSDFVLLREGLGGVPPELAEA
ncbi:L-threonylcarbamoyladenylate synthase [Halothiobacillus sp. DCM-1]|uniref:L-threonylcarbamoyladenylate synthase n=1 Tax=Halothiobacillus sp. DCM-1 TaxID=3112558 RepID=UPI00324551F1